MRRYSFILLLLGVALCCFSQQRSRSSVNQIVKDFARLHNIKQELTLKAKSSTLLPVDKLPAGEETFYVYTSSSVSNKAFMIISADKRLPEVLAYSEENDFDIDNIPPAVSYWLGTYSASLNNTTTIDSVSYTRLESLYASDGVQPLLGKTIWSQGIPFNNYCPTYAGERTVTGCVATAMAQVMKYYEYPIQAQGGTVTYLTQTHNIRVSHDFSKDHFDWMNMLNSYQSPYSATQAESVATLMASCGASVQMDYGISSEGGSAAYQYSLLEGYVDRYGYDKDASYVVRSFCTTDDWHELLISELNAGRPVNYGGSGSGGGHSFILDGYRMSSNTYPDYHVNWGWAGLCDGYYQLANLTPKENGTIRSTSFSEGQCMVIGIKPEDGVNDNTYTIVSSQLNCSLTKAKRNSSVSFNVTSLYNLSYKTFAGMISVALQDSKGNLYVLDDGKKYNLSFLNGSGSLSFTLSLPNTITSGTYKVCLVYRPTGFNEWHKVYSTSRPNIEITNNGEIIKEKDVWSEIGCSEIEMFTTGDRATISARVYEIINLQEESFDGKLLLTLADENGYPILSIGKGELLPELGFYDYLTEPIILSGKITQLLQNGQYRLYISSTRTNSNIDSYVVENNLAFPGSQTKELYLPVEIKNGTMYVGNCEYDVVTTDISDIISDAQTESGFYTISGTKYSDNTRLKRGLYIVRSKGKYTKIIVP